MPRERDDADADRRPSVLAAEQVGRRVGDRWLFRDLSFSIAAGSRLGVAGPSGTGKTLLLRAAGGLDALNEGRFVYDGQDIETLPPPRYRADVCYLAQNAAVLEGSVEHNLSFPFTLAVRRTRTFVRERALELLERFELDGEFLRKESTNLSGGEAQIVALVRALLVGPKLLLLDEATAHLDAARTRSAEALVEQWQRDDGERCSVWVSHAAEQLDRVCDTRLELRGPPS